MTHEQAVKKLVQLADGAYFSVNEQTSPHIKDLRHQYIVYLHGLGHFISEKNFNDAIKQLEQAMINLKNRNLLPAHTR